MTGRGAGAQLGVALGLALLIAPVALQQGRPQLRIQLSDGSRDVLPVFNERGYDAVPISAFDLLGWSVATDSARAILGGPQGAQLLLWMGSSFFRWHGRVLQLASPPYLSEDSVRVPLQLFVDFLPQWFPDRYQFDTASATLRVHVAAAAAKPPVLPDTLEAAPAGGYRPRPTPLHAPAPYEGKKVVVIDPGHGGIDPGAMSRSGIREKTVALAIAKDLAKALSKDSTLEIHMTRTDDTLIPLWDRGAEATKWKGKRPGVFISIHCNSFQGNTRGFETYFLSEARTEHEKRVAANENAPLRLEGVKHPSGDLDAILHQLRTLDYQHWSALLAQMIQSDLAKVDPSPDRGVKQGPFAVITNALMPAVLVEVGYLSNPDEARLLARPEFQSKAAGAIARAVVSFFRRYPPGSASGGTREGR